MQALYRTMPGTLEAESEGASSSHYRIIIFDSVFVRGSRLASRLLPGALAAAVLVVIYFDVSGVLVPLW
jgi:hypothetical protein